MKRGDFIHAVFDKVGIEFSPVNRVIGIAWCAAEGSSATNNPLDTTEPWEGATDYNDVGVKNYPTWDAGVDATVATLNNGDYEELLATFKNADATIMDKLNAINSSPWGSHVDDQLFTDVRNDLPKFDTEVAGSPADTPVDPTDQEYKPTEAEQETAEKNKDKFVELPVLKEGDSSKAVSALTRMLDWHGYLEKNGGKIGADFTPEVTAAVKEMQEMFRLPVTGIVDAATWSAFFY